MQTLRPIHSLFLAAFMALSCVSLDYDLSSISVDVSAKPAVPADGEAEDFVIEAKNVRWVHGLFGHSQPDVAELLAEKTAGADRITGFRVRQTSNFHQWLLTHLSLTMVRMRTVVIEGQIVRAN